MSNGYSGASRDLSRRRRWLSQLSEESPLVSVERPRRARAETEDEASLSEVSVSSEGTVSSLLPRRTWVLASMVVCGLLTWATVVGVGLWLDLEQLDPWRDIFGLQSGRLVRFYTTIALLTCAQLSYLILWRRSRSRKDFSGKYRIWFWVGAVCSIFCVATATRFHETAAANLTRGLSLVWVESATLCWMVPASAMLLSAMHLMRRDMPYRSASTHWVQVSRGLAFVTGSSLLIGSWVLPARWMIPVNAALSALWPTVFAATLLIHVRFVTYVTNEAARELRPPSRTARWEARLKIFARHVSLMASEEWQLYQLKRAAVPSDMRAASQIADIVDEEESPVPAPKRERRTPPSTPSTMAAAPLQRMGQRRPASDETLNESQIAAPSAPETKAVNVRPISRTSEADHRSPELSSSIHVHPAQPIPPPHFPISEQNPFEESDAVDSDTAGQSESLPAGYSKEQWRSLSKKDRKRLMRAEALR